MFDVAMPFSFSESHFQGLLILVISVLGGRSGFRILGLGFLIWVLGFGYLGFGFWFWVVDVGFGLWLLDFGYCGPDFVSQRPWGVEVLGPALGDCRGCEATEASLSAVMCLSRF